MWHQHVQGGKGTRAHTPPRATRAGKGTGARAAAGRLPPCLHASPPTCLSRMMPRLNSTTPFTTMTDVRKMGNTVNTNHLVQGCRACLGRHMGQRTPLPAFLRGRLRGVSCAAHLVMGRAASPAHRRRVALRQIRIQKEVRPAAVIALRAQA